LVPISPEAAMLVPPSAMNSATVETTIEAEGRLKQRISDLLTWWRFSSAIVGPQIRFG
jgi:hypothetical protein